MRTGDGAPGDTFGPATAVTRGEPGARGTLARGL